MKENMLVFFLKYLPSFFLKLDLENFKTRMRSTVSVREGQGVVLLCGPPPHSGGEYYSLFCLSYTWGSSARPALQIPELFLRFTLRSWITSFRYSLLNSNTKANNCCPGFVILPQIILIYFSFLNKCVSMVRLEVKKERNLFK